MAPRPRTIDDTAILRAAGRIISRLGPGKFTLAQVAREAGLSAATLIQRFGSKRRLMLALATSACDSVDACFAAVRSAHSSPLDALMAAATEMTNYVQSPEEMANHLAFLQTDLSDPDFYAVMLENSRRIEAGYRALLDEAMAAGELKPCDTDRLARAVGSMSGGSLIAWAVYRQGTAQAWVRADLATLLDPYRLAAGRPRPPVRPPGRRRRARHASKLIPSAKPESDR
jgi:AcrR family transcriptional regulator